MKDGLWCLAFVFLLSFPDRTLLAQDQPVPLTVPADTESRVLMSRAGRQYQITVALPRTYHERSQAYPVIFVLDANLHLGTTVEAARNLTLESLIPEVVVVGIGYPVGQYFYTRPQRTFDLTPTPDTAWLTRSRQSEIAAGSTRPLPNATGGAPDFYRFLTEELIPHIENNYRVAQEGRALLGHSFSGLFVLYAMLRSDRVFDRFLVSSPSIWWDKRAALRLEETFSRTSKRLPARAFISVGADEPVGTGPDAPRMVANVREFDALLRSRAYEGLEFTTTIFDGETHISVMPAAISRGLRWLYGNGGR